MLRTVLNVSLVLVVFGGTACSGKSGDEGTGNAAGTNGSIIGGTGGAGTSSNAGTSGTTGGTGSAACDGTIVCVDETQAQGCNSETGVVETFDCIDELDSFGFVSSGCTMDPTGDYCAVDSVKDEACRVGTAAIGACGFATTDEELFNVYVNCYLDNNDGHAVISCFGEQITSAAPTAAQCSAAEDTCIGGSTDTGGTGGGGAGGGSAGTGGGGAGGGSAGTGGSSQ